jgi:hypothetical protein
VVVNQDNADGVFWFHLVWHAADPSCEMIGLSSLAIDKNIEWSLLLL